jgi:hypothetical protein
MRKLALLTLPILFAAGPVLAQQSMTPGFDNQTGHAQNAARMSGLHTPNSQVHQTDTNAANAYSGAGQPGVPLTTATSPPSQNGAMPLAGAAAPGSGANGSQGMTQGGGNSTGGPR